MVLGMTKRQIFFKTTLLRCLNFLETPDSGIIKVKNEVLFD